MSKRLKPDFSIYMNFIDPKYQSPIPNVAEYREKFNIFFNELVEHLQEGEPETENAYLFNTHMGSFVRHLDQAKDAYFKALLALKCSKKEEEFVSENAPVAPVPFFPNK
jgi:hypothetical protein